MNKRTSQRLEIVPEQFWLLKVLSIISDSMASNFWSTLSQLARAKIDVIPL